MVSVPGFPSLQYSYILFWSGSHILAMGLITAAVPQAPASTNDESSSTGTCRRSVFIPRQFAMSIRLIFVIEFNIDSDFGVTYVLSLIPKKFAGPHSSTYFFSFASRKIVLEYPPSRAAIIALMLAA